MKMGKLLKRIWEFCKDYPRDAIFIALIILVAVFYLVGIYMDNKFEQSFEVYDLPSEVTASDVIENADSIELVKKTTSLNRCYYVLVDGKKIATVEGKFIKLFGDTFELKDNDGNVIMSEDEIYRVFSFSNRKAEFSDGTMMKEDWVGDFFDISRFKFHLIDEDDNEYAYAEGSVLIPVEISITVDNEEVYTIKENMALYNRSYTINRNATSKVSMEKAILLTAIADTVRNDTD